MYLGLEAQALMLNRMGPLLLKIPRDGRCHHKARKACNGYLKRAFFLGALTSLHHDAISKEYVERRRLKGILERQSIKMLARRVSAVICAIIRDKNAYDRRKVIARKSMKEKKKERR